MEFDVSEGDAVGLGLGLDDPLQPASMAVANSAAPVIVARLITITHPIQMTYPLSVVPATAFAVDTALPSGAGYGACH